MCFLTKLTLVTAFAATLASAAAAARTGGRYLEAYAAPDAGYGYEAAYPEYRYPPLRIACDPEKDGSRCEFRRR